MLGRLKNFLPKMAQANEVLEEMKSEVSLAVSRFLSVTALDHCKASTHDKAKTKRSR